MNCKHGSFDRNHLVYSYPDIVPLVSNVYMPDYFLTMGKSWGKGIYTPSQIIVTGNDYFISQKYVEKSKKCLLFISTIVHGEKLSNLAIQFIIQHPDFCIKYKLHTNEYNMEAKYKSMFAPYPNIEILKNEIELGMLIARCEIVVLINSTVLYEALDQGAKVAVFKVMNYYSQSECFSFPNVFLFDTIEELEKAVSAEKKVSNIIFFEKFNKEKFKSLFEN